MLVSELIQDEAARERIRWQSALMLAAISLHRRKAGQEPARLMMDEDGLALVTRAREEIERACKMVPCDDEWAALAYLTRQ